MKREYDGSCLLLVVLSIIRLTTNDVCTQICIGLREGRARIWCVVLTT